MKIRQKLLLGALGFGALVGIMSHISIQENQELLERSIGNDSVILAHETLDKIDRSIYSRIEEVLLLSRDLVIREAVRRSNMEYDQMADREDYINEQDRKWVAVPEGTETPFMKQLSNSGASQALQARIDFYKKIYGYRLFSEIFVTNKYGVNAIQTNRTTDFRQNDEIWWQKSQKEGLYVQGVRYDESSKTRSLEIGVRIEEENGDFLGVMKAVLNIDEITSIIETVKKSSKYASAKVELLSADGQVIYETNRNTVFDAPTWVMNEFRQKKEHVYYSVMDHPGEGRKLIVHGHSHGYRNYKGLGWFLIIEYNVNEVFAPVLEMKRTLLGISLLGIVLCILIGAFFSRSISAPITKLEKAAVEISRGRLNVNVDVGSKDEVGFLADTFNKMVDHLKDQRERAEKRTNELTALYEVSNSISYTADYQQLLALIMKSVFRIIDYDICGALFMNVSTANILIKPSYPQSAQYADQIKSTLMQEFAKFRNREVTIRPGNVRVVPVDEDVVAPAGRTFGELRSSFNAPILVNGKVIGVINFSSAQEHLFSADEVKFIYTVTNQVSNAIERIQMMISAEKSKIENMIESMLEGAVMLDEQGEVAVLNPQAREMLGLAPEGEIASEDLTRELKKVNLDAALDESFCEGQIIMREVVMPHNDGRILQCTVSPVGPAEKRDGTVIILRDVTREKEIDRMKTEFISLVSHELRTPLSITKEGLSLILDKVAGDITQKQEMILTAAKDNMDRLARLINNVLDVSKMEAGKMEVRKERLNIAEIAAYVMSTFELKAKDRGLELKVSFPDGGIEVFADRDKSIQVFTNLINNALKFTLAGSVEVSGKVDGDMAECTVADTGIGISENDLEKTFIKFQQVGRSPGSGEKGTGLGLTIAKGIVEMHGGRIRVESKVGVGTKFIFTLPKYTPDAPLIDFVDSGVREAQKANTRMSLLSMKVGAVPGNGRPLPDQALANCLINLEYVLRKEVHRQGDAVFRNDRGCFVTLANCSKEDLELVAGRFQKALDDYLAGERLQDALALQVGTATYPSDARDSVELLRMAGTKL